MNITFIISLIMSFAILIILVRMNIDRIRKYLNQLAVRLHIRSLRTAINEADKDKEKTDRKNIVVFNTSSGSFEPVQKRLLKNVAHAGKNTNNAALTKSRRRRGGVVAIGKKKTAVDTNKVKLVEKKSLYTTK